MNRRYGAIPTEALDNVELMNLLLPVLRADIAICETYVYSEEPPLPCPITALGGENDREVSLTDLEAWRDQTVGPFQICLFPGDHFFIRHDEASVVEAVARITRRS